MTKDTSLSQAAAAKALADAMYLNNREGSPLYTYVVISKLAEETIASVIANSEWRRAVRDAMKAPRPCSETHSYRLRDGTQVHHVHPVRP